MNAAHCASRSISLAAILVISIVFLLSCAEDAAPPGVELPASSKLTNQYDTLYSTSLDSVNLVSVFTGPVGTVQLYSDFGDGTPRFAVAKSDSVLSFYHLYPANGVYTYRIWGEADGKTVCADSSIVIVQDYVRPSEANTVTVTLANGVFTYNTIYTGMGHDSSAASETNSITLTGRSYNESKSLIPFSFNGYQTANCICETTFGDGVINGKTNYKATIILSPDGKAIYYLSLYIYSWSGWTYGSSSTRDSIVVRDVPISLAIPPTRQHAVYSMQFGSDQHNIERLALRNFNATCVTSMQSTLVSHRPNPLYLLTVTFSKE